MTLVAAGVVPSQVWTLSCEHWKVRCLNTALLVWSSCAVGLKGTNWYYYVVLTRAAGAGGDLAHTTHAFPLLTHSHTLFFP